MLFSLQKQQLFMNDAVISKMSIFYAFIPAGWTLIQRRIPVPIIQKAEQKDAEFFPHLKAYILDTQQKVQLYQCNQEQRATSYQAAPWNLASMCTCWWCVCWQAQCVPWKPPTPYLSWFGMKWPLSITQLTRVNILLAYHPSPLSQYSKPGWSLTREGTLTPRGLEWSISSSTVNC